MTGHIDGNGGADRQASESFTSIMRRLRSELSLDDAGDPDRPGATPSLHGRPRRRAAPVAAPSRSDKPRFVVAVSTWNREAYVRRFVETFVATRSDRFDWGLVVADDGSLDGTLPYLRSLEIPDTRYVLIENKRATIAGQANSILRAAQALGFDFAVKCDDDVFFAAPGWDSLYYDAAIDTGRHHLVYHNPDWKPQAHDHREGPLRSWVAARDTMGCFYTFTPAVLDRVGFMDEVNFPFRGHSHIDFTVRCCRAGFNDEGHVWDALGGAELVAMWPRDEYVDLVDWDSPEVKELLNPEERSRRMEVIDEEDRLYLDDVPARPAEVRSQVHVRPVEPAVEDALLASPRFRILTGPSRQFDRIFVLNLGHDVVRWSMTAEALSRHGLVFERFPGVNGNLEPHVSAWRSYADEGLVLPEEHQIGRKLIQSPGAWGYLLTMERLLEEAKARRLNRILVFDDDIMLHTDFEARFEHAWSQLPSDWKVVYLGCTQRNWDVATPYSESLYHPGPVVDGSFAVALDSSVFDLLLESIRQFEWPYDAGPLRRVSREFPDQTFALQPHLVVADVTTSSIRAPRDLVGFAEQARWNPDDYERRVFARAPSSRGRTPDTPGLVSVVIYAHDDEATLADALGSLRSQTHGKLEILAIDDSSSDRSREVLSDLARLDSRISVFHVDERHGAVACTNALLRRATGEFVMLHGAGEVSHPDRLAHLVSVSSASPDHQWIEGTVNIVDQPAPDGLDDGGLLARWMEARALDLDRQVSGGIVRRSLLDRLGEVVRPGADGFEELVLRAIAAGIVEEGAGGAAPDALVARPAASVPTEAGGDAVADWKRYHAEVAAALRPAFFTGTGSGFRIAIDA